MAQIIQANITAENGIVHIIDQVRLRHDSAIFATFVCWSTFFCALYLLYQGESCKLLAPYVCSLFRPHGLTMSRSTPTAIVGNVSRPFSFCDLSSRLEF